MTNGVLSYLEGGAGIIDLAKDTVNVVKYANDASNLSKTKQERKEARIAFVENLFNVAVPVGLGIAVAVSPSGGALAALPVVLGTHTLVRKTGIGRRLGVLLEPALSPVFDGIGKLKLKLKNAFGFNVDKKVDKGANVAANVLDTGKAMINIATPVIKENGQQIEALANTFTPAQGRAQLNARTPVTTSQPTFNPFRRLMRLFS